MQATECTYLYIDIFSPLMRPMYPTPVFPSEAAFMVRIRLEDHPQDKNRIHWSHQRGENIDVKIGTFCNLQIVTRKRPVLDLLFNRSEN